jgi:hypothetical protein
MSIPVAALLAFALWTITLLAFTIGVLRWSLIFSGKAELKSFPGDEAHGTPFYRRATRAHMKLRREPARVRRDRVCGGGLWRIVADAGCTGGGCGDRASRSDDRAPLFRRQSRHRRALFIPDGAAGGLLLDGRAYRASRFADLRLSRLLRAGARCLRRQVARHGDAAARFAGERNPAAMHFDERAHQRETQARAATITAFE